MLVGVLADLQLVSQIFLGFQVLLDRLVLFVQQLLWRQTVQAVFLRVGLVGGCFERMVQEERQFVGERKLVERENTVGGTRAAGSSYTTHTVYE